MYAVMSLQGRRTTAAMRRHFTSLYEVVFDVNGRIRVARVSSDNANIAVRAATDPTRFVSPLSAAAELKIWASTEQSAMYTIKIILKVTAKV